MLGADCRGVGRGGTDYGAGGRGGLQTTLAARACRIAQYGGFSGRDRLDYRRPGHRRPRRWPPGSARRSQPRMATGYRRSPAPSRRARRWPGRCRVRGRDVCWSPMTCGRLISCSRLWPPGGVALVTTQRPALLETSRGATPDQGRRDAARGSPGGSLTRLPPAMASGSERDLLDLTGRLAAAAEPGQPSPGRGYERGAFIDAAAAAAGRAPGGPAALDITIRVQRSAVAATSLQPGRAGFRRPGPVPRAGDLRRKRRYPAGRGRVVVAGDRRAEAVAAESLCERLEGCRCCP